MIDDPFSWVYFPTAVILGGLHALEPGHDKTLTAAYLIGIKGTKRDAFYLGLSVALTHSLIVILISVCALWIGREAFTQDITRWLQIGSGVIVILLGLWMFTKRWLHIRRVKKAKAHLLEHEHGHHDHEHNLQHDHDLMDDDAHARAHAEAIPEYVKKGERPTYLQIFTFGAAGGMIPCPASITVMLLALSIGKFGPGLFALAGFSLGLALTLVGVGLLVVAGIDQLKGVSRLAWISTHSPLISAGVVILSGCAALLFVH